MKQILCTQKRWERFIEQLLKMAQGNLTSQIPIKNYNDDFEKLEILVNLINEEWMEGVLNASIFKPKYYQKYIRHFQIILNHKLDITAVSSTFENHFKMNPGILIGSSIKDYLNTKSYNLILKLKNSKKEITYNQKTILFLNEDFLFSLAQMTDKRYIVLNLYQFHTDLSNLLPMDQKDKVEQYRIQKRYLQDEIVDKVRYYLDHADFSKPLRIDFLCKEFGINKNHLTSAFMENFQCGPYEYFTKRKMEEAFLLVSNSELTLTEIGLRSGYHSYPNFSNAFFKHYGIRPRILRKKQSNNLLGIIS